MSTAIANPREQAKALVSRKELIEQEIQTQQSILQSNNADLSSPLVDADGFPRADLDIYAVRRARVRIIELRNDHAAVMNEIGKALEGVYEPGLVNGSGDVQLKPFAKIDEVASGGPAAESGLRKEDLILKFGHIVKTGYLNTSDSLVAIAELVGKSENSMIPVKVLRSDEPKVLALKPRKGWGGRGLLGCHIVPFSP